MTVCVEKPDAARLMTSGGDARLVLSPIQSGIATHSAPRPSGARGPRKKAAQAMAVMAYARTEAVLAELGAAPSAAAYAARLEAMRGRIRAAYGVPDDVRIVFAPSGTDLEYVALALVAGRGAAGTHAVLLGADEVGSGCIHSAHGLYFANETALGVATTPGVPVPGLGGVHVELVDIPVRDRMGGVRPSRYLAERMLASIAAARAASRHSLVHIVHGSKTGLVLPHLDDVDVLRARFGEDVAFVVDACQARITSPAIADYLTREAIVFVTGGDVGGARGFALVPPQAGRPVYQSLPPATVTAAFALVPSQGAFALIPIGPTSAF